MQKERKVKEKKGHDVPWKLVNLQQCHDKQQVQAELILPSRIPKRYTGEWAHPLVRLDLRSNSHALTIMRNSTGSNILHARLVIESPSGLLAWVEPFRGNLEHYLRSTRLGLPPQDTWSKHVLPSPILRSAVGGVVDGMKELILSGNYHGDFSFFNTYYTIDEKNSNALGVKLCNFKEKKTGSYKKKLFEDWKAILAELKVIREIAQSLKQVYPSLDYRQLDGLINFMARITPSNAELAYKGIRLQPFFWGKLERRLFFIHEIALGLKKKQFILNVRNAKNIGLPWNNKHFRVLLAAMNDYRKKKGKPAYDTSCPVDLVKCISGLYTHEHLPELQVGKKVDDVIQEDCPDLCYNLYMLLPGANL